MLNNSVTQTSDNNTLRISPREFQEIKGDLNKVLNLFRHEKVLQTRELFRAGVSNIVGLSDTADSLRFLNVSKEEILQIIRRFQSATLQSQNPFLVAFLNHDIIGPLSVFYSYFNLLEECHDDPDLYGQIANLYSTVQDAEWFVRCFIENIQFWTDPSLLQVASISLEKIVERSIFYTSGRVGTVPVVHLPHDFQVQLNEGIIGLLLVNIFKNALFRGRAGLIDVVSEPIADNRIRLNISDDGVGVSDELGSSIFDLGVSGAGSTGIGLGDAKIRLAACDATIQCVPHGGLPSRHEQGKFGAKFVIEMASSLAVDI